jgi:hypothetical protein
MRRVRDVLIWTSGDVDVSTEEFTRHPPIASPPFYGLPPDVSEPLKLGRGLSIDRLSDEDAELVMNACTPRGHYFAPIRQFNQVMAFVREIDHDEWQANPFRWDTDGVIWDALSLSRLIRDNNQSTRFAARIADFEDGEQRVVYTLTSESKNVYRLRHDRDWLDRDEGVQLANLLAMYWSIDDLPSRVTRAMWRTEYASWLKWGDLALPILVSGLEALLKTEKHPATRQFTTRVPAIANELGFDGVTAELCDRMYDARSDFVHGAHVRLFAGGQEAEQAAEEETPEGPEDDQQERAFADIALLQDVLRAAMRRCFEDEDFRAIFADDDRIRSRWPVDVR